MFTGLIPSGAGRENLSHASLPDSGGLLAVFSSLAYRGIVPVLPLYSHGDLVVCVSPDEGINNTSLTKVIRHGLLFRRTPVILIRAHSNERILTCLQRPISK